MRLITIIWLIIFFIYFITFSSSTCSPNSIFNQKFHFKLLTGMFVIFFICWLNGSKEMKERKRKKMRVELYHWNCICVCERCEVVEGLGMMECSPMCLYETFFRLVFVEWVMCEWDWRQDGCGMHRTVIAGASLRIHFCDVMITSVLLPPWQWHVVNPTPRPQ